MNAASRILPALAPWLGHVRGTVYKERAGRARAVTVLEVFGHLYPRILSSLIKRDLHLELSCCEYMRSKGAN